MQRQPNWPQTIPKQAAIERVIRTKQPSSASDVVAELKGEVSDTWVRDVAKKTGYPFPGDTTGDAADARSAEEIDLTGMGEPVTDATTEHDPELLREVARLWNERRLMVDSIVERLEGRLTTGNPAAEVRALLRAAGCGSRSHLPEVPDTPAEQRVDQERWEYRRTAELANAEKEREHRERSTAEELEWEEDHAPHKLVADVKRDQLLEELEQQYGLTFNYEDTVDGDHTSRMVDEVCYMVTPSRSAPAVALAIICDRFGYVVDRFFENEEVLGADTAATLTAVRDAASRLANSGPVLEAADRLEQHITGLQAAVDDLESACDLAGDEPVGAPTANKWAALPEAERPTFYVSGHRSSGFSSVGVTDPLAAVKAQLGVKTLLPGDVIKNKSGGSLKVLNVYADNETAVVKYQDNSFSVDDDGPSFTLRTWRNNWDEHGQWFPTET